MRVNPIVKGITLTSLIDQAARGSERLKLHLQRAQSAVEAAALGESPVSGHGHGHGLTFTHLQGSGQPN